MSQKDEQLQPGDQQLQMFVSAVLSKFHCVANDGYTKHFWTSQEILAGHQEDGHPFFDYNGWHREWQEQGHSRTTK